MIYYQQANVANSNDSLFFLQRSLDKCNFRNMKNPVVIFSFLLTLLLMSCQTQNISSSSAYEDDEVYWVNSDTDNEPYADTSNLYAEDYVEDEYYSAESTYTEENSYEDDYYDENYYDEDYNTQGGDVINNYFGNNFQPYSNGYNSYYDPFFSNPIYIGFGNSNFNYWNRPNYWGNNYNSWNSWGTPYYGWNSWGAPYYGWNSWGNPYYNGWGNGYCPSNGFGGYNSYYDGGFGIANNNFVYGRRSSLSSVGSSNSSFGNDGILNVGGNSSIINNQNGTRPLTLQDAPEGNVSLKPKGITKVDSERINSTKPTGVTTERVNSNSSTRPSSARPRPSSSNVTRPSANPAARPSFPNPSASPSNKPNSRKSTKPRGSSSNSRSSGSSARDSKLPSRRSSAGSRSSSSSSRSSSSGSSRNSGRSGGRR